MAIARSTLIVPSFEGMFFEVSFGARTATATKAKNISMTAIVFTFLTHLLSLLL